MRFLLNPQSPMKQYARLPFEQWPLDLLMDYALKLHHRTIRREGPKTLERLQQLAADDASLQPVVEEFTTSLNALEQHLLKEENVLFPYLYELFEAYESRTMLQPMHCGTINNPIRVMMMEHDEETERHRRIAQLTDDYTLEGKDSEKMHETMERLKEFRDALMEHIYIENEVLFGRFSTIEEEIVVRY